MEEKWALILGASSGFGGATAIKLAKEGYHIFGVHLDRRPTMPVVENILSQIKNEGVKVKYFNINAADSYRRHKTVHEISKILRAENGRIHILLHSLAFGALRPFFTEDKNESLQKKQVEMTLDVMANSLIYWTQEIFWAKLFNKNAKIFAITSAGSEVHWKNYGAVSAAKSALESYCRQITFELAGDGITANAIMAGVTDTPALRKIPGNENMIKTALSKNPRKRLTIPEDVANVIALLSKPEASWISGNVIHVDGGEMIGG